MKTKAAPIPDTHYWLIKSEPKSYGIDQLQKDTRTAWTGVRNYLARNYMKDGMHLGDYILFYHSSCKVPGVYGIAKVVSTSYPDPTQFINNGHYFEPRATNEKPVWFCVDIQFVTNFEKPFTIKEIRNTSELHSLSILQPGSRLSITPVTHKEFNQIYKI